MPDLQIWRLAVDAMALAALVASMVAGIYAWRIKREQVTRESLDALNGRLAVAETRIEMLPGMTAWQRVADQLSALRADMRGLQAEIHGHGAGLKRVESQVALLLENELKGDRG